MRNKARSIILMLMFMVNGAILSAQCVPDTINCVDTEGTGQFCPIDLPRAGLDVLYDEVVTVIPPGSFEILGTDLSILHIEIDSVKNLPPGISYFPNAEVLYPDTAYCIQLTGTPTQIGVFPLSIYISATVEFMETPTTAPVVDTSSIVVSVVEVLGLDPNHSSEFLVAQNAPNPFSEITRMAYFTPQEDRIGLKVYNVLGLLVHDELRTVPRGEHYFEFDGNALEPGTYFYRAESSKAYFTGKLIKLR